MSGERTLAPPKRTRNVRKVCAVKREETEACPGFHVGELPAVPAYGVQVPWHPNGYATQMHCWQELFPPTPKRRETYFSGVWQATNAWLNPKPWHTGEGRVRGCVRFEGDRFTNGWRTLARRLGPKTLEVESGYWYVGGVWDWRSYKGWGYSKAWQSSEVRAGTIRHWANQNGWTVHEVPRVDDPAYNIRCWSDEVRMWLTRAGRARVHGENYKKQATRAWQALRVYCERVGVPMPDIGAQYRTALIEARLAGV